MFDWGNYLKVAQELSTKNEEEYKRSAVSRAYYSAFCNARNFVIEYLNKKGYPFDSKENVHLATWNAYQWTLGKQKGELGKMATEIYALGDRLKKSRHEVDYKDKLNNVSSLTIKALKDAERINSLIKDLNKMDKH